MTWDSGRIICPFFKNDTKNSIKCEGIESSSLINCFEGSTQKKQYVKEYCAGNPDKCQLSQILQKKYEQ